MIINKQSEEMAATSLEKEQRLMDPYLNHLPGIAKAASDEIDKATIEKIMKDAWKEVAILVQDMPKWQFILLSKDKI
jgi:hypothetical protein